MLMLGHYSFHAWQSSLVFTAVFVCTSILASLLDCSLPCLQILHLILSWSKVLSWILFVLDLGLIAFLTLRAYQDGELSIIRCSKPADVRLSEQPGSTRIAFFWRSRKLLCRRRIAPSTIFEWSHACNITKDTRVLYSRF